MVTFATKAPGKNSDKVVEAPEPVVDVKKTTRGRPKKTAETADTKE